MGIVYGGDPRAIHWIGAGVALVIGCEWDADHQGLETRTGDGQDGLIL